MKKTAQGIVVGLLALVLMLVGIFAPIFGSTLLGRLIQGLFIFGGAGILAFLIFLVYKKLQETEKKSEEPEAKEPQAEKQLPRVETYYCKTCGNNIPTGLKFCPACGEATGDVCITCGTPFQAGQRFCPNCGASRPAAPTCSNCGKPRMAGARHCPDCGHKY